ncbi:MAG: GGDEF domain-containing protein [Gammaproteobacteria bacterium]|nr:GGDEF domain-containing protein [Gammaproteobacteria bacterium]MBT8110930.1 GGDEF domain-containing protein [Gammaproteobacteria bacterium]NND47363.1 GGDEF domain-containing protein [Woeseiaceae bacterium]NNL45628.1 GGDEF domain-containing protein [Woeseiaceae bacterium]
MLNKAAHIPLAPSFLPHSSGTTEELHALDQEFRRFYVHRMLPIARAGIALGLVLAGIVCILDIYLMPANFVEKAMPVRIATTLLPLAALLAAMFVFKENRWLPYMIAATMFVVGASILFVGAIAMQTGAPAVPWGLMFTTFYVYLVLGLTLRQSVAVGWPIFLVYLSMSLGFNAPLQKVAYGALFLGFSNLIGTYGSYLLERNAREIFDSRRELTRLAHSDVLTGLFNRRMFDQHLRQVWMQARRDGMTVAVVVIDIDYFKLYNDCYGHQAGDDCIKRVADALASAVSRPLDMVARYGGEEYVMVLCDPTTHFLESFTRDLCQTVADLDIEHKASEAARSVTVSVGAALTESPGSITPEQLIRQADDALYEAKSQGRNRAILYRTEWGQQTTANLAAMLE